MRKLGIGLVGCGYWGKNYLRIIYSSQVARLVGVVDQDPSRFDLLKNNYTGVSFSDNVDDILNNPEIEAVVICTSVSSHFMLVKSALTAGKHVLCEKPLALTVSECETLTQMASAAGLVLLVGHVFEYNSIIRYMRGSIENESIGSLQYLHLIRSGLGPIREDVNVVYDLASHDISIAISMVGEMPVAVSASGACIIQPGREDIAFIVLEFAGGLLAQITNSWIEPMKQRMVKVVGSKKMLLFDDVSVSQKLSVIEVGKDYQNQSGDFGSFQLSIKDGQIIIPNLPYPEPLQTEFTHFIDCVVNGESPLTGGEYATQTVKVIEAIQRSLKSNQARIEIK